MSFELISEKKQWNLPLCSQNKCAASISYILRGPGICLELIITPLFCGFALTINWIGSNVSPHKAGGSDLSEMLEYWSIIGFFTCSVCSAHMSVTGKYECTDADYLYI